MNTGSKKRAWILSFLLAINDREVRGQLLLMQMSIFPMFSLEELACLQISKLEDLDSRALVFSEMVNFKSISVMGLSSEPDSTAPNLV